MITIGLLWWVGNQSFEETYYDGWVIKAFFFSFLIFNSQTGRYRYPCHCHQFSVWRTDGFWSCWSQIHRLCYCYVLSHFGSSGSHLPSSADLLCVAHSQSGQFLTIEAIFPKWWSLLKLFASLENIDQAFGDIVPHKRLNAFLSDLALLEIQWA